MHWYERLPLRVRIGSIGIIVVLLMMTARIYSAATARLLVDTVAAQDQAQTITARTEDLLTSLLDMETGVRGYVITGDPEFLEPYYSGVESYPALLQQLESLVKADPDQSGRATLLLRLADQWNREVAVPEIEQVRAGQDARALVQSKRGKALMDQIRQTVQAINQQASSVAAEKGAAAQRAATLNLYGAWVIVATAASLALFLSFRIARSVTQPIEELIEGARQIAAGDVGYQVPVRRHDEIGGLATHFNKMSSEVFAHMEETAAQNEELQAQQEELSAQNEELIAQQELLTATMTELESERDRVKVQRDNLRAIMDATSEGICMIDADGQIILRNERYLQLLDVRPGEQAETYHSVFTQVQPRIRNLDEFLELSQAVAQNPDLVVSGVIELTEPQGRVLERFTAPVYNQDGRPLGRLYVLRDISREYEIDRMKTEFISTVSHELRTPLTSIRGYVDLILEGDVGPVSAEQREFLELVSRNTVRLAHLIDDLLDVEKIEQGRIGMRREPFYAATLLDQVVRTARVNAAEKGLTLDLTVQGDLPAITGDEARITQVFTNLISNAVKYTKAGGIAVTARVRSGDLVVSVADSGIGIPANHLPNLFQKFYRVDNQYTREVGGAGLGLAITKAIVEQHGGKISVQSEVGQGSTFTVSLPVSTV